MAGPLLPPNGSGRRSRFSNFRPMAEINVTPFVDVMLVLLIVFMVTAPLLTVAVPLDLPQTNAQSLKQDKEPLVISIDAKGRIYLQETKFEPAQLVARLKAITGADPQARIFVRGDKGISYGKIMEVMGTISAAGFTKIALVAELPKEESVSGSKGRR